MARLGPMSTDTQRSRCRERVLALSSSSAGSVELRLEAVDLLKRTLGFDRWCWSVGDPDSLVAGGDLAEADLWPVMPRIFALEQWDELNAPHVLARRRHPVGSLSMATGGELAQNASWDECLRPFGVGDQATLVLRDAYGSWGYLKVWRNREDRPFAAEELEMLEDVAPALGSILRRDICRSTLLGEASAPAERQAGVLIVDAQLRERSATASAQDWLDLLPGAAIAQSRGYLPQAVYAVAARASAAACPSVAQLPARLRTRTTDGRWSVVEAAPLLGHEASAIAVTLRAPTTTEVLGLVCRAHALTARESQVLELVVAGLSTRGITERLCISTYTLQDHLKAIFDKMGVRNRRELLRGAA
jgi:DNA-binding NarL/FixJ family response regulator